MFEFVHVGEKVFRLGGIGKHSQNVTRVFLMKLVYHAFDSSKHIKRRSIGFIILKIIYSFISSS